MVFFNSKNFNILSGIIIIILSILLLLYSVATVFSILIILAIIMIFIGITQVISTKSDIKLEGTNLIVKYLIGVIELVIGIFFIITLSTDPIGTAIFSIRLLGFALLLTGLAMLYVGSMNQQYSKEYRYILMIIGLITLIFGIIIMMIPTIGFTFIAIIIALPLLLNGLSRLLKGFLY